MEQSRRALAQANELFASLQSGWALIECEVIAKQLLSAARRRCHGDEAMVQADLLAALIMSLNADLRSTEETLLTTMKMEARRRT